MTARRVPVAAPGAAPRPLARFTFDGREYEGVDGEPLAASLLAADRLILSRSFRFHRPRGLMCSTGSCGWCECEIDGVPSVRSCRVPVRTGLVARGEHAWPSVDQDLLSLVGLASRWIPPTFYHHRFLRPRRLRKLYLDVLRWFGGRGRLRAGGRAPLAGRPTRRIETDVLVVGGGRSGLLAALGAAEAGGRVVLVDAGAEPGGWRRAPGEAEVGELAAQVRDAGVGIMGGTVAIGWYAGMVAALGADAHLEIRADSVVAATGSYDRVPLVPGNDRPGVMAARTVTWLLDRHGILPGDRALLVGEAEELAHAREGLGRAGATCLGPIATASLVSVRGRDRVTGAIVGIAGKRQQVSVDLVVFADRSPNLDLVLAAGGGVRRHGDTIVPATDGFGRTSVASLFVAGSATGRPILGIAGDDVARAVGRAAAAHAAGQAIGPAITDPGGLAANAARVAAPVARGAMVCFCEDVRAWEIRAEQVAGYVGPELIKRRTGALTGPCQGKSCLQAFACLVGDTTIPTARPPLRPIRLGDLAASGTDGDERT